jgi:hypothetical protein
MATTKFAVISSMAEPTIVVGTWLSRRCRRIRRFYFIDVSVMTIHTSVASLTKSISFEKVANRNAFLDMSMKVVASVTKHAPTLHPEDAYLLSNPALIPLLVLSLDDVDEFAHRSGLHVGVNGFVLLISSRRILFSCVFPFVWQTHSEIIQSPES